MLESEGDLSTDRNVAALTAVADAAAAAAAAATSSMGADGKPSHELITLLASSVVLYGPVLLC